MRRKRGHTHVNDNSSPESLPPNAIAVVGMAAGFRAPTRLSAFWDNLRRGEESIVTLSESTARGRAASPRSRSPTRYTSGARR